MAARSDRLTGPLVATRIALKSLSRRVLELNDEVADLDQLIDTLITELAPDLLASPGVGNETAGQFFVAAGDNPDRLRSEASFAIMCGACPIPASSGKTNRHHLNRGGNRQASSAVHMVVVSRIRMDERTQTHVNRRLAEGLSKRETMRCLKCCVAREDYGVLTTSFATWQT
jgi:transposase